MKLGPIPELWVGPVSSPGQPNLECVPIRVQKDCDIGEFCLIAAIKQEDGSVFPINNAFFWFGNGAIRPGDWIFVYTGSGEFRQATYQDGSNGYSIHWGNDHTMFADQRVVPVLLRINGMEKPPEPQNLPQKGVLPRK